MARKKSAQTNKSKKKRAVGASKVADPGVNSGGTGATTGNSYAGSRKDGRPDITGGAVPNLFWGAVSMDELRACPRFVGLPGSATPQPALPCLAAAKYLRQDSPEWRQLHTGVLTTGLLKEALGLREPLAARVVGGRKESSHAPLLAAFQHLQHQPLLQTSQLSDPEQEAAWRRQMVQGMLQLTRQNRCLMEQHQLVRSQADDQQQERYLQCLAAVRNGGLVGVRCGWGKVQEGAALAQLLHIFPACTLHEVGLCCVPASTPATASWPGLPLLAASPDAIIAHHLLLPPRESDRVRAALADMVTAAQRGRAVEQQQQQQPPELQGAQPPLSLATNNEAQRLRQLLRDLLDKVPMSLGRGGSGGGDEEGDGMGSLGQRGRRSGDGDESHEDTGGALEGGDEEEDSGFIGLGSHGVGHGIDGREDGDDMDGSDDGNCGEGSGSEGNAFCSSHDPGQNACCESGGDGSTGRGGPLGSFTTDPATVTAIVAANAAANAAATVTANAAAAAAGVNVSPFAVDMVTPEVGSGVRATNSASVHHVAAGSVATADIGAPAAGMMLQDGVLAAVLESPLPVLLLCAACGGCSGGDEADGLREPQTAATDPSSVAMTGSQVSGIVSLGAGGEFGCTAASEESCAKSSTGAGDRVTAGHELMMEKANAAAASEAVAAAASEAVAAAASEAVAVAASEAVAVAASEAVAAAESGSGSMVKGKSGDSSSSGASALCTRCDARAAGATALGGYGGKDIGGGHSSGGGSAAAEALGKGRHSTVHVVLREVVEVKNTCPFGLRQVRRGGKGRMVSELFVSDPGPRQAVLPLWVPQLQLHMLATGCQSGLLVSRSATKGTTVFRMFRDDDYLHRMLGILQRFNREYVRRGVPPPCDMFARQPEYVAFLNATARLARTAVPLTTGSPWRPAPRSQSTTDSRDVAGNTVGGEVMRQWPYSRIDGALGNLSQGEPDRSQSFLGGA